MLWAMVASPSNDRAMIYALRSADKTISGGLIFMTRLSNGTDVVTTNSPSPGMAARQMPTRDGLTAPEISVVVRLYDVHRRRLSLVKYAGVSADQSWLSGSVRRTET
jgi:hypothetical protein